MNSVSGIDLFDEDEYELYEPHGDLYEEEEAGHTYAANSSTAVSLDIGVVVPPGWRHSAMTSLVTGARWKLLLVLK